MIEQFPYEKNPLLSVSKNYCISMKSSFPRSILHSIAKDERRESSAFNIFWIARSSRAMTKSEFLDKLLSPLFVAKGNP